MMPHPTQTPCAAFASRNLDLRVRSTPVLALSTVAYLLQPVSPTTTTPNTNTSQPDHSSNSHQTNNNTVVGDGETTPLDHDASATARLTATKAARLCASNNVVDRVSGVHCIAELVTNAANDPELSTVITKLRIDGVLHAALDPFLLSIPSTTTIIDNNNNDDDDDQLRQTERLQTSLAIAAWHVDIAILSILINSNSNNNENDHPASPPSHVTTRALELVEKLLCLRGSSTTAVLWRDIFPVLAAVLHRNVATLASRIAAAVVSLTAAAVTAKQPSDAALLLNGSSSALAALVTASGPRRGTAYALLLASSALAIADQCCMLCGVIDPNNNVIHHKNTENEVKTPWKCMACNNVDMNAEQQHITNTTDTIAIMTITRMQLATVFHAAYIAGGFNSDSNDIPDDTVRTGLSAAQCAAPRAVRWLNA